MSSGVIGYQRYVSTFVLSTFSVVKVVCFLCNINVKPLEQTIHNHLTITTQEHASQAEPCSCKARRFPISTHTPSETRSGCLRPVQIFWEPPVFRVIVVSDSYSKDNLVLECFFSHSAKSDPPQQPDITFGIMLCIQYTIKFWSRRNQCFQSVHPGQASWL